MSGLLADTHVILWYVTRQDRLGRAALRAIDVALSEVRLLVSPISFWEIAMLHERGRLRMDMKPAELRHELLRSGVKEQRLDGATAILSIELRNLHGDPADRLLVASAIGSGAEFMTADEQLLGWDGPLARIDARL